MNKVWMVTGAGRGLGRAFVQEAVSRGDSVIAAVRRLNENDALFQNENVLPVLMDVTDAAAVKEGVAQGIKQFGRIDVLVNNAGFGMTGAFEEVSDEELRTLFETDYFGVVAVTKAVLPVMRRQKSGMILNVSSQAGAIGFLGSSAYCSAKFAVVGLSEALAMELAPFGIQTAAVLPGSFRTDFRDQSSMKLPKASLAEYEGSAVHQARNFLMTHNHMQEGDPAKAARFLYSIVAAGTLPRRILIGKKCCNDVRADLARQLADIDAYYEASSQTAFDV